MPISIGNQPDHGLNSPGGQEMADRRGVDPQLPPARCKHVSANRQAVARISINR